jgi:orotidine-5'-phosphate decarboxylase
MINAKDRLIIALDYSKTEEAKALVKKLGDAASHYKVGLELFLNSKGEMVEYLSELGKKIFLDLKFHDIPNTTTMASIFAAKENVMMFNIHASGGRKMMSSVAKESKAVNPNTLAIAVTVLTSMSQDEANEVFDSKLSLSELVVNWARLAKESGMDGVVCSPWEAKMVKEINGKEFKTVCPGVRPRWAAVNDQERIMTPKEAIINGCDFLVVGRPITKNENPVEAARMVLAKIEEGLKEAALC